MSKATHPQDSESQGAVQSTPGKPHDSSSRQQTQKDQTSQSGSPAFDKEMTRKSGTPAVPAKPPGAK